MASITSWIYDKPLRGDYTFTHDELAKNDIYTLKQRFK